MNARIVSRKPSEASPRRMSPLARLPVFYALTGKRVLVAGGDAAAAWKVELLAAAGAHVDVYAAEPSEDLLTIVSDPPAGGVTVHRRSWTSDDLPGCLMAVAACDSENEAQQFYSVARRAGVPCNVIDKPDFCDFNFGAVVNRSPLVVGISTDGAAPVFAQAIRARIEALMPSGFALWADAARQWRPAVKSSGLPFNARRRFWQLFTRFALLHPDHAPAQSDFERMLDAAHSEREAASQGSVTLVGAGPGDPELLTLRAVRALQSADVILFDDLVSNDILDFARREAKRMLVGKTGYGPSCKQGDINALMIGLARSGRRVVRLKSGDPMIFGRAGEEIEACRAAGIAVDVVPGITAAQGVASRLGMSLTHRKTARRVQFVTGHSDKGELPSDLDWRGLSDPAATTVVYMPVRTLAAWAERAIAHGLDPMTPAIAVARVTQADEQRLSAPIGELPARLAKTPLHGPVVVIVGRALDQVERADLSAHRDEVRSIC